MVLTLVAMVGGWLDSGSQVFLVPRDQMVNRPDCVCVLMSLCVCGKCVLGPRDQMVMRPVAMCHAMSVSGPQEANWSSDHSM